jgi:hypothetical protein
LSAIANSMEVRIGLIDAQMMPQTANLSQVGANH